MVNLAFRFSNVVNFSAFRYSVLTGSFPTLDMSFVCVEF